MHGIISFRELAAMVANSWKEEDDEIVKYLDVVADKARRYCYLPAFNLVDTSAKASLELPSSKPSTIPDKPRAIQ